MMTILYISLKKMIPRFLVGARWEIIEQSRLNTPLDLFDFSYYNYKVIYIWTIKSNTISCISKIIDVETANPVVGTQWLREYFRSGWV